jgi:hypothetical protein
MIKIDCHAHANAGGLSYSFPRKNGTFLQSYHELLRIYAEENIDAGILMPLVSPEAQSVIVSNDEIYSITQKKKQFLWCCNIDPRMIENSSKTDFSDLLLYYKSKGALGLGELTSNLRLLDPMMENLLYYCAEIGFPVTIHWSEQIGESYGVYGGTNMEMLEYILLKYPKLIIIGHSVPFWRLFYIQEEHKYDSDALTKLMRRCPNLYCDTSANSGYNAMSLNESRAYKFLEEFSDRILLGLDISYSGEMLYKKILKFYDDSFYNGLISSSTYEKICFRNAMKLYPISIDYGTPLK